MPLKQRISVNSNSGKIKKLLETCRGTYFTNCQNFKKEANKFPYVLIHFQKKISTTKCTIIFCLFVLRNKCTTKCRKKPFSCSNFSVNLKFLFLGENIYNYFKVNKFKLSRYVHFLGKKFSNFYLLDHQHKYTHSDNNVHS